jgi:hypothetical protein
LIHTKAALVLPPAAAIDLSQASLRGRTKPPVLLELEASKRELFEKQS